MKRLAHLLATVVFSLSLVAGVFVGHANAAFNKDLLIDDVIFNDSTAMSAGQIDTFLNTFANSCISPNSGFAAKEPIGYTPSSGFTYGDFVTAGQVLATSSTVYGINPQVLLVTLEKEQSLVTGRNSTTYCGDSEHKYAAATGYGCPDSGGSYNWTGVSLYRRGGVEHTNTGNTCVNSAAKAGFSQQVIRAAWLLKFSQERSLGHTDWAVIKDGWDNSDDLAACYSGYMTQGTFKRCPNGTPVFYDGWATIDNTATHMDTGATASLYRYTPHFHGNQLFVSLFESWFGSTISALYYACKKSDDPPTGIKGRSILANKLGDGKKDYLSLVIYNYTSSGCIEIHTWNPGQQSWFSNIATNRLVVNTTDTAVISGDQNGDGKDEMIYVKYRGTASGKIEIHTWDPTYQHWFTNIATNHPGVNPADDVILTGDTDGDKKDEIIFVKYRGTASGKIEIHTWNPSLQTWRSNVATNRPAVDPANTAVIAGDTDGDGKDELIYVRYLNTGSGKIEIHTWNPSLQTWRSNVATNHASVDQDNSTVLSADTDGDGKDELIFVKYAGGASGKIEIHTWAPSLQSWTSNIATNHPAIPN